MRGGPGAISQLEVVLESTFGTEALEHPRWIKPILGIAVLVTALTAVLTACDIDGQTFRLSFLNDTGEGVFIQKCENPDCKDLLKGRVLGSGDSLTTTGVVDVPTWWLVTRSDGSRLGCFHVDFDRRPSDAGFLVSSATNCP